jgi:hypothetical protein
MIHILKVKAENVIMIIPSYVQGVTTFNLEHHDHYDGKHSGLEKTTSALLPFILLSSLIYH